LRLLLLLLLLLGRLLLLLLGRLRRLLPLGRLLLLRRVPRLLPPALCRPLGTLRARVRRHAALGTPRTLHPLGSRRRSAATLWLAGCLGASAEPAARGLRLLRLARIRALPRPRRLLSAGGDVFGRHATLPPGIGRRTLSCVLGGPAGGVLAAAWLAGSTRLRIPPAGIRPAPGLLDPPQPPRAGR
jgi:hypothetical protein